MGDLQERFQAHPSGFWFWRQVLQTIIITALEELRSHKLLAVRAVVVGWLALGTALELLNFLQYTLSVVANGGVEVAGYWIVLPTSYFSWVYRYGQYVTLGTMAIAGLVSGWIVRRFHSGAMLLTFSAFVLVWALTSWTLDPSRGKGTSHLLGHRFHGPALHPVWRHRRRWSTPIGVSPRRWSITMKVGGGRGVLLDQVPSRSGAISTRTGSDAPQTHFCALSAGSTCVRSSSTAYPTNGRLHSFVKPANQLRSPVFDSNPNLPIH